MPIHTNLQKNDTVQTKKLQINTIEKSIDGIKNMRKTIEISSLNKAIDTTRITKKIYKPRKVIKVLPIAKKIDSLQSPVYNTFTNCFEFPDNTNNFFDNFEFTLPNPKTTKKTVKRNKKQIKKETTKNNEVITVSEWKKTNIIEQNINNQPQGFLRTDWTIGILIVSFLLFGWLNVRFSKFIKTLIESAYNYFTAKHIQEEKNIVRNNVYLLLNILFFINTAFVLTLWTEYNHATVFLQSGIILFFIYFLSIIVLYALKSLFFITLDFIFLTKKVFSNYNATIFIYNKVYGIALLPLLILIPFVSANIAYWLFIISLIIFIILYLGRILRGIRIVIKNRLSIFYLILYLCTLEILPIMLMYKTIKLYVL